MTPDPLIEPFRVVWGSVPLRYTFAVVCIVFWSETMSVEVGMVCIYTMLGYNTPAHEAEQQEVSKWWVNMCNIILVPSFFVVGCLGRRFGAAPTVFWTLPLMAALFASPALLMLARGPLMYVLTGYGNAAPFALFPLLNALTIYFSPPNRVGEVVGAFNSGRALGSLIAPLLTAVTAAALPPRSQWLIFAGSGVLMLFAWPFAYCLMRTVRMHKMQAAVQNSSHDISLIAQGPGPSELRMSD